MNRPSSISEAVRSPLDDDAGERIRARVLATRRAPRPRRRTRIVALAATAAIVALVLLAHGLRAPSPRPFLRGGEPLRDLHGGPPRTITLDDGTSIHVERRTHVRVIANQAHEVVLELVRGQVELDVRTMPGRRVVVDAGLASVEVVGTRFTVSRERALVRVEVSRGRVHVRGERVAGRVRSVVAGESISIRAEPPELAAPSPPRALVEPAAPALETTTSHTASPARARQRAPADPVIEAPPVLGVRELFDRADTARREGRSRDAIHALAAIVDEHPQDARASVAALSRARIELDVLDEPREARRSLELALALGLPAALEEDARARRIEALARAGDPERAREAAHAFLARWPGSRHESIVRRFGGLGLQ